MSEIPRYAGTLYSPAESHLPSQPTIAPRWTRDRPGSISSISFHRRSSAATNSKKNSHLAVVKSKFRRLHKYARRQFGKMKWWQKVLTVFFVIFSVVSAILVTVYHTEILSLMLPVARQMSDWPAGWLIVWGLCYVAAFPPMIGYSTSVSMAGFIYGFPNGWFIVSSGTILGSTSAFLACRYYFRAFAQRMVATDKRFAALSLTLKHDGLKLLCMIRLCPLPYSIANGAISTFPTVKPWAFMLATAISTPKLMIHIFIGSRLRMLAEEGRKMDGKTKAINYASLLGGIILGVGTGLIIYRRTIARAKQLEHEERARLRVSRSSLSSGRPSIDPHTPAFTDLDDEDEEQARQRDPRAAQAASLIGGLIEGEDDENGLFDDDAVDLYDEINNSNDLERGRASLDDDESEEELLDVRTDGVRTGK